jgi:hypothetical protein
MANFLDEFNNCRSLLNSLVVQRSPVFFCPEIGQVMSKSTLPLLNITGFIKVPNSLNATLSYWE